MASGQALSPAPLLEESTADQSHPNDSSRILLGLMALSRQAELAASENEKLDGVISRGVLRSMLSALHFRDVATVRHVRRVARLAIGVAQYLGWEGRHLKVLEVAALLHDIGKIGVPDNILFKPGKLSPDEAELMALHHNIGVDVLQACHVAKEVLDIVIQSHSFYNGATDGFRRIGGSVHQGARILAVADAYDSLSQDQVYRKGKSHEEIIKILQESGGTQFDGNVVCALSRWFDTDGQAYLNNSPEYNDAHSTRGPSHPEETLEASSLCHIFSYLYLLESLYDGFYLLDSDLNFVVWNRGAEKLLGHSGSNMLQRQWTSRLLEYADQQGVPLPEAQCPLRHVIEIGKSTATEVKLKHAGGDWVDVELQTVPLMDGKGRLQGVAEILRDLSRNSRKPLEYRELKMAASRDPLTSLANRGELETQISLALTRLTEDNDPEPFSLIFLDVDHFKSINDTHGHTVGDQVLVDVAKLLQHETYSGELIARYGGEEFVVLCPDTELEHAVKRADRLRLAVFESQVGGMRVREVTASFGVSQAEPGDSIESLLRRADKAMYAAKEGGRNRTSSLTNSELLAGETAEAAVPANSADRFLYTGSFFACVAADMIVYKLGGFVNDESAQLIEVTPKRARVRMGSRGLFPFWGASDDRRPIQLEVEFGDDPTKTHQRSLGASSQVKVTVRIRPLGWVRDVDVFRNRAKRAVKTLRSYFVAD